MFNFFNIDPNRIMAAAIGALVLSTACVGAAVGPARALEIQSAGPFAQVVAADEASA